MAPISFPFMFDVNYNFNNDSWNSVTPNNGGGSSPPPPVTDNFMLLDTTPMLVLDDTNFKLL